MPSYPPYTLAFRAWLDHVGGIDVATAATGIGARKLQRFYSGKERPHPRLLRELAIGAEDTAATALGQQLRDAADAIDAARAESAHA